MRRLLKPLWILLALVFLAEAWLWEHLKAVVGRLVAFIPWRELKMRLAAAIEHLPPAATLLVFLVPAILLFPIKLLGLWMLAHGHWFGAVATLGAAKIVGMGITAFVFDLTRPKLLQLAWFRWVYDHVVTWLAWAHGLIDPIKTEVRLWLRAHMAPVRRRLRQLSRLFGAQRAGGFSRRLWRIRARMRLTATR